MAADGVVVLDVKDGPYVIEMPPGAFIGLADDHHQGWILDTGLLGPAGDKDGKHLVLPPGYKEEVPAGYFTGTSASYKALDGLRAVKNLPAHRRRQSVTAEDR